MGYAALEPILCFFTPAVKQVFLLIKLFCTATQRVQPPSTLWVSSTPLSSVCVYETPHTINGRRKQYETVYLLFTKCVCTCFISAQWESVLLSSMVPGVATWAEPRPCTEESRRQPRSPHYCQRNCPTSKKPE